MRRNMATDLGGLGWGGGERRRRGNSEVKRIKICVYANPPRLWSLYITNTDKETFRLPWVLILWSLDSMARWGPWTPIFYRDKAMCSGPHRWEEQSQNQNPGSSGIRTPQGDSTQLVPGRLRSEAIFFMEQLNIVTGNGFTCSLSSDPVTPKHTSPAPHHSCCFILVQCSIHTVAASQCRDDATDRVSPSLWVAPGSEWSPGFAELKFIQIYWSDLLEIAKASRWG